MKKTVYIKSLTLGLSMLLTTGCANAKQHVASAVAEISNEIAAEETPQQDYGDTEQTDEDVTPTGELPESAKKLVGEDFIASFKDYEIKEKDITAQVSYGHKKMEEKRDVDIIIIHSSYHAAKDTFNTQGVINQFKRYNVAPHYLISRDGTVWKMVEENDVAWQAGKSQIPGTNRTGLNNTSIGIEVMSTKHNAPTKAQYEALTALVAGIRERHHIKYLLRHADIAPTRRDDPWGFDWINWVELVKATSGDGFVYFTTKVKNIASFK